MKKSIFFFSLFIIVVGNVISLENQLVTSTTYFDFIYTPSSQTAVSILVEHADTMAIEICDLLDTSLKQKIPVYINANVENLNAYFSPVPYNRIVLYDAVPIDGDLAVFENSLLMVFYHELTHAISMNIRTPFWHFLSSLFGDFLSPTSIFTMPLSFLEGVTVSFESANGQGRLHDPLTNHYLIQDKIENKFLSWKKSSGALDRYPYTKSAYIYGGAFSSWLQDTYGMELYAELWNNSGSFDLFKSHLNGRIKQTYGRSLDLLWKDFEQSIQVPPLHEDVGEKVQFTSNGILSCLTSGPDGIAWLDASTKKVYFKPWNSKPIALFDADSGIHRLEFSKDGRFMLVSGLKIDRGQTTNQIKIYDVVEKKFTKETYQSIKDACFGEDSSIFYGVFSVSQDSYLVKIDRTSKIKEVLHHVGPYEQYPIVYNPVYIDSMLVACIGARGLQRSLLIIHTESMHIEELVLPDYIQYIRYLSLNYIQGKAYLSFSWAQDGSLYRAAVYDVESKLILYQDFDVSGAVFNPVLDVLGESLYYKASFSSFDSIMSISLKGIPSLFKISESLGFVNVEKKDVPIVFNSTPIELYNPLPWFFKGTFFPWAQKTYNDSLAPGFVFATGDPSEKVSIVLQPAILTDPFFLDTNITVQTSVDRFVFSVNLFDALFQIKDNPFYRSTKIAFGVSTYWTTNTYWKKINLSQEFIPQWRSLTAHTSQNIYTAPYTDFSFAFNTDFSYNAIKNISIPIGSIFAVQHTGYSIHANNYITVDSQDTNSIQQALIRFRTPILPLELRVSGAFSNSVAFGLSDIVFTFDTSFLYDADIKRYLPRLSEYKETSYADITAQSAVGLNAEFVLFNFEIQKGLPLVPLYSNRILLATGYQSLLCNQKKEKPLYLDSIYLKSSVQGTIIYGALSTVLLSFDIFYAYPLREGNGSFSYYLGSSIEY